MREGKRLIRTGVHLVPSSVRSEDEECRAKALSIRRGSQTAHSSADARGVLTVSPRATTTHPHRGRQSDTFFTPTTAPCRFADDSVAAVDNMAAA